MEVKVWAVGEEAVKRRLGFYWLIIERFGGRRKKQGRKTESDRDYDSVRWE